MPAPVQKCPTRLPSLAEWGRLDTWALDMCEDSVPVAVGSPTQHRLPSAQWQVLTGRSLCIAWAQLGASYSPCPQSLLAPFPTQGYCCSKRDGALPR